LCKNETKRIIQYILLSVFIIMSIKLLFHMVNNVTTHPIELKDGILNVKEIDNNLYVINGSRQKKGTQEFIVKTNQNLSIAIHNLAYPHNLSVNGQVMPSSNYAYKIIPISKGETSIKLSGANSEQTSFFVSQTEAMKDYLELRIIVNAFLLFIHLMVLIGCLFNLYYGKNKIVTLLFFVFVLSSIIKGINLGELSIISSAIGMNSNTYNVIDGISTAINNILPIYVLMLLFDIELKKKYMVLLGLLIIPLAVFSQDIFSQIQIEHTILSSIVLLMIIFIMGYGYVKRKNAALQIIVLRSVFLVLASTYLNMVRSGLPISNMAFFFNYAYLGATIYLMGILSIVISFYVKHNRALAYKEKEYERIMLLKGIGHDLKHPVLTAKLNNQYLLECDLKKDEKESVMIALKALGRLDKMIVNINDYFNIQSLTAESGKISLKNCLRRIEESYKEQSDNTLIVKSSKEDCIISINPEYFYRIIDNLIDNAFKYNDGQKVVTITYQISGSQVLIDVVDNGRGLDEEEIHIVFDIFYRGEKNRTTDGFGIGLSVVKQLVESSGGEILVQSKKKSGTKFSIKLPIEK